MLAAEESEQAAPSDVAHDAQEAEKTDNEGDAVHHPELPHILGDGLWQVQVLAQYACTPVNS